MSSGEAMLFRDKTGEIYLWIITRYRDDYASGNDGRGEHWGLISIQKDPPRIQATVDFH
jgi:hypothetical protein